MYIPTYVKWWISIKCAKSTLLNICIFSVRIKIVLRTTGFTPVIQKVCFRSWEIQLFQSVSLQIYLKKCLGAKTMYAQWVKTIPLHRYIYKDTIDEFTLINSVFQEWNLGTQGDAINTTDEVFLTWQIIF